MNALKTYHYKYSEASLLQTSFIVDTSLQTLFSGTDKVTVKLS